MTQRAQQPALAGFDELPPQVDAAATLREAITDLIAGSGKRKEIAYALYGERSPQQRLSAALLGEDTFFDVDHIVPALLRCKPVARAAFVKALLRLLDLDVAGGRIVERVAAPIDERIAILEDAIAETERRRQREIAELRALKGEAMKGPRR